MTTLIKTAASTLVLTLAAGAALFQFAPGAYATLAYPLGLPVTDAVKRANPPAYLEYQERLLAQGERRTRDNRQRLEAQRKVVEERVEGNRHKEAQVQLLLDAARTLYADNPAAGQYEFVGKRYTPAQFGDQVVLLDHQLRTYRAANQQLAQAQALQQRTFLRLVETETELDSKRTLLATNRVIYDSERILNDLNIDVGSGVDVGGGVAEVDNLLRTADELARALATSPQAGSLPTAGIGNDALRVLRPNG